MRVFAPAFLLAASLFAASPASAQTLGLFLPNSPSGPGGEDSIETAQGTRCRQSINGSGPYLDMGLVGTSSSDSVTSAYRIGPSTGATAYARLTIPLGQRPRRIDCTRLYELEIGRLRREIELLRLNAE